jgi:hypothetical protein
MSQAEMKDCYTDYSHSKLNGLPQLHIRSIHHFLTQLLGHFTQTRKEITTGQNLKTEQRKARQAKSVPNKATQGNARQGKTRQTKINQY